MPERAVTIEKSQLHNAICKTTIPIPLDDINSPAIGGKFEPTSNHLIVPITTSRNLPTAEPVRIEKTESSQTVFPSSGSLDFTKDFEHINALHSELGIEEGQRWSYDPAKDRARFERATTDKERQAVRLGIIEDQEKNLYERADTSQSTVTYYQDNQGVVFNPNFPGEPFEVVLQRGVEYSKSQGYVDYQRETKEIEGWKKVMSKLFNANTVVGSKAVVISGPGLKKGSIFTDNFVDIFTKAIDPTTGKVIVMMTRFASGVNYYQYREIATKFDRDYFNVKHFHLVDQDSNYLEHPIFLQTDQRPAEQIFQEEFVKQRGSTAEGQTKEYIAGCRELINHYTDTICSKLFNPEKVKLAFNAILNKFESLRRGIIEAARGVVNQIPRLKNNLSNSFSSLHEEVDYYGRMEVEQRMVGCGLSSGFSLGGIKGIISTVLRFGKGIARALGIGQAEHKWFVCPRCGYKADGPVGDCCPEDKGGCGLTKEEYSRTGGQVC